MPDIREGPSDGKTHLDLPSVMGNLTEALPRSATRFVYASFLRDGSIPLVAGICNKAVSRSV